MDDVAFSRELLQARLLVELMSQAAPYLRPGTVDAISEEDYDEMRVNVAERVEQWLVAAVEQQESEQNGTAAAVPGVK